jgi:hypothetical protein
MQAAVQFKHIHIIGHQPQEGVGIPIEAYGEILLLSAVDRAIVQIDLAETDADLSCA